MLTLEDLRKIWEQFQVSAVENQYNQWMTPKDLDPIANELIKAIEQYVEENNADTKREQHKS
jgi:hypothetical protein